MATDLPDATFFHLSASLLDVEQGDGKPLGPDPSHLAGVHNQVEDSLFRDGTIPHCDPTRASKLIRRHLERANGSAYSGFGERYRRLLETLMYGRAVYDCLSYPFSDGRHWNLLKEVPDGLHQSLFGQPLRHEWELLTTFRLALRASWYFVRSEKLETFMLAAVENFNPKDLDDFVSRADTFITHDFEQRRGPGDFYDHATIGAAAYMRWQRLLLADVKNLVDVRETVSDLN